MPVGSFFSTAPASRTLTGSGTPSQPRSNSGDTWGPPTGANSWPAAPAPQYPQTRQQGDTGALGSTTYMPPNYQALAAQASGQSNLQSPYASQVNPLAAPTSLMNTFYGPQQQLLANTLARQYDQLGAVGVDTQYRSDALRRDTTLSQQGLGLDRQALGQDANLTREQQANLSRLRGILGQQYGLQGETLANQLAGLNIDESKARDLSERSIWDLRSNLTARGAYNTVANERGTGRTNRDLSYQLQGIDVNRQAARLSNRGNILGLDEKGIGYDNQAAGLASRLAGIGIDTQRLSLSEQQLNNSLQDGLYQIGLQGQVSINGLLDAISGTNTQQAQLATTILGQIAQYSTLPPDVLAQITAALTPRAASSTVQSQSTPPL